MKMHTSVLHRIIKLGIKSYKPIPTHEIPLPSAPHGPENKTIPMTILGPGKKVLEKDEDAPTRPALLKTIIRLNNRLTPVKDDDTPWESAEDGKRNIHAVFGKNFPESRVDWNGHDPAGDEALRWWVFNGFGAFELHRLDEQTAGTEQVSGRMPRFVSSYEFLKDLPVRPGLASYGGAVYLDEQGNILKIKLRGKDVMPNEGKSWEAAKFAYRSTSLVWATLYHHLFYSHYTVSNTGVLATIHSLPTGNPLRLLLKPFLFRTAAINNGGVDSLLPPGAAVTRATGFTKAAFEEAFSLMNRKVSYQSLPDWLQQRGLDSHGTLPESVFSYGRDGELFWNTLHQFSFDVLQHAPAFRNFEKNDAVKAWWERVNTGLGFSRQDLSAEHLSTFLTQFFYTVTGFHSWVGHVTPYVLDPSIAAGKLYPESTMTDQQNSAELGVIAAITGLPIPTLMGDFSHLMPDDHARKSLSRLHTNLLDVGEVIRQRNTERAIPSHIFLPEEITLSVAI